MSVDAVAHMIIYRLARQKLEVGEKEQHGCAAELIVTRQNFNIESTVVMCKALPQGITNFHRAPADTTCEVAVGFRHA